MSTDPLEPARRRLEKYQPVDPEQRVVRDRILAFLDAHPEDAHRRTCLEGHLTASALLVDPVGQRVLLLHHKKLGKWLQPGGHCDGDPDLAAVALRECQEESGISDLEIVPEIIDLDIHRIPARPSEPDHWHLDSRFLVIAKPDAAPIGNHETHAVRFFGVEEALEIAGDDSLRRLIRGWVLGAYP